MKIDLRWQLLLVVLCVALLFSILNYQVQSAGTCTTRVPASRGDLVEGLIGQPRYLNPLLSQQNPVDQHLVDLIFDGLIRYGPDGQPQPALASSWDVSEDGRIFTFTLRDDARWHDGRPVTVDDVAFTYGQLQDDSFPAPEASRMLWQSVAISPTSSSEITFVLPEPYGPFIDATSTGILPQHALAGVPPSEIPSHGFSRSPVGTGPFLVAPGSDWQRSGSLRLAPNPLYWRGGARLDAIQFRFFEDDQALRQAFESGEVQAISVVPAGGIEELGVLDGMRLYSAPFPRYTQLIFNMKEEDLGALQDPSVRQALAKGIDRHALIDRALAGQGLVVDGPYLPQSWAYVPNKIRVYDGQADQAAAQLDAAGWTIPEDSDLRLKDGRELTLRVLVVDDARFRALVAALADQWSALGVGVELVAVPSAEFVTALDEGTFDVAIVDIEPGNDPDMYDFWSQEAIVRGQNYGGWNNRRASEALENARKLVSMDQRRPYYEAFQGFFDADLPAVTLYQHVYTYGLSDQVQQAEIGRIDSPRDRYESLDQWFLFYREAAAPCPGEVAG